MSFFSPPGGLNATEREGGREKTQKNTTPARHCTGSLLLILSYHLQNVYTRVSLPILSPSLYVWMYVYLEASECLIRCCRRALYLGWKKQRYLATTITTSPKKLLLLLLLERRSIRLSSLSSCFSNETWLCWCMKRKKRFLSSFCSWGVSILLSYTSGSSSSFYWKQERKPTFQPFFLDLSTYLSSTVKLSIYLSDSFSFSLHD